MGVLVGADIRLGLAARALLHAPALGDLAAGAALRQDEGSIIQTRIRTFEGKGTMMRVSMTASVLLVAGLLGAAAAQANDLRTGVAGAIGGGAGAAVGNAVGGSTGAIVGGAVGGAAGGALGAQGSARTGAAVGGAIGGGAGAAVGNSVGGSTGAVVGAAVGGGAGAVVGGMVTEDKPKTQAVRTGSYGGAPAYYQGSCNRNNPGKGLAKGHCK